MLDEAGGIAYSWTTSEPPMDDVFLIFKDAMVFGNVFVAVPGFASDVLIYKSLSSNVEYDSP